MDNKDNIGVCPHCHEKIPDGMIFCPHCLCEISDENDEQKKTEIQKYHKKRSAVPIVSVAVTAIVLVILCVIIFTGRVKDSGQTEQSSEQTSSSSNISAKQENTLSSDTENDTQSESVYDSYEYIPEHSETQTNANGGNYFYEYAESGSEHGEGVTTDRPVVQTAPQ